MSGGAASVIRTSLANARQAWEVTVFGLIGSLNTTEEGRDVVVAALLEGCRNMPGNVEYLVAEDAENPLAIWVTEVWESEDHHQASLSLPSVREAIAIARPHITGMGQRIVTRPLTSGRV